MKHRILTSVALLLLCGPALARTPDASVVRVRAIAVDGDVKWGSAVVIAPDRLATTCHVTRRATRIEILRGDERWLARSQTGSVAHDLCLLVVDGLHLSPVTLRASSELILGERVTALGFEHGNAALASATGAVKALYPYDDGLVIRTSAEFDFGSSGGGLFDEAGSLVGLLAFKARAGADLRFALPIDWLAEEGAVAARFEPIDPASPGLAFWEYSAVSTPTFLGAALREARDATR